ncbi:response regulator [Helicobacter japonicus]|uniref:Response regulator n=1 Tax=Helicobacter japonicus TaxID=425400 RepID=A0A4U8TNT0_9HELI|nr:response regulator [Helicobacter japonicus]MDE7235040.1 response regulator [Helicobacter japonicus]TLE02192.1 response regulator [Helicobacter japonicus]
MKVLIIEDEIYLAQSIANKLSDSHLDCVIAHSLQEVQKDNYDVILASFRTINKGYTELSKLYPQAIIILMIAYINDDTVIKPLRNGVTDYIVKPFIVDELIRKITHYKAYREMREEIKFYRSYFSFIERELGTPEPFLYNPPFVIKTNTQRSADIYAMRYAREKCIHFQFHSLKEENWKGIFRVPPKKNEIYYITNLEELKKSDRKDLLELALKYSVIFSIVSNEKVAFPQVIDIARQIDNVELGGEILSVKEYEKIIISKYESRYPDIELAKKLGMSRKSLWEKRKKYGIIRKNKNTPQSPQ